MKTPARPHFFTTISTHINNIPVKFKWQRKQTATQLATYNHPFEEEPIPEPKQESTHDTPQQEFPATPDWILGLRKDTFPFNPAFLDKETVAEMPALKKVESSRVTSLIRTKELPRPAKGVTDTLMDMAYPSQTTSGALPIIKTTSPLPDTSMLQAKYYEVVAQSELPLMLIKHTVEHFFAAYHRLPNVVYVSVINKYKMEQANYAAYWVGPYRIPIENDVHIDHCLRNDAALAVGKR